MVCIVFLIFFLGSYFYLLSLGCITVFSFSFKFFRFLFFFLNAHKKTLGKRWAAIWSRPLRVRSPAWPCTNRGSSSTPEDPAAGRGIPAGSSGWSGPQTGTRCCRRKCHPPPPNTDSRRPPARRPVKRFSLVVLIYRIFGVTKYYNN